MSMPHLEHRNFFLMAITTVLLCFLPFSQSKSDFSAGLQEYELLGASAHWVDVGLILWSPPEDSAYIAVKPLNDFSNYLKKNESSNAFLGRKTDAPIQLANKFPHLSSLSAFALDIDTNDARILLRKGCVAVAYDAMGKALGATRLQIPGVLDALYTSRGNDADEASLGAVYQDKGITVQVWGPTAQNINLLVFQQNKSLIQRLPMMLDSETGIWRFEGDHSIDRKFYQFEVSVVDPLSLQIKTVTTTDPYAVSLSTNGEYAQFVNLEDDELKPKGWDEHVAPVLEHPNDAVIYEGHIRDFSIGDVTVSKQNRGKYLAFTELNSDGMQHLSSLVDAGLTHFHMLPVNDIATINERADQQINTTDTLDKLCPLQGQFRNLCDKLDKNLTLNEVMETFDPLGGEAQAFLNVWRDRDGFNWGYDPHHFNAPEGSYSSNPDGVARIVELRAMNMALHSIGLRVVMDVVYNHSSSSGFNSKSVFDKIVPGYYHRLDPNSGVVERSTCCENLAPEHRMMEKFLVDSLTLWAKFYRFDGFRFDLMGHIPREVMLSARHAVQSVDPDTYFYGEGWDFGEVAGDARFIQATQLNLSGTAIGTYNDRFRDAIRGAGLFSQRPSLEEADILRVGLAGSLSDYVLNDAKGALKTGADFSWKGQQAGYAKNPLDIINYVSKHDDETLWDKLQYALPGDMIKENRVRIHNLALAMPLMAQGIPFLQLGGDLVRSKSMNRNTYDAGDWFNRVDFTKRTHNWAAGLPMEDDNQEKWPEIKALFKNAETRLSEKDIAFASEVFKEFLRIRSSSRLFRLTSAEAIVDRVSFLNTGSHQFPGLIVMKIEDGMGDEDIDPSFDAVLLVINGAARENSFTISTEREYKLHRILENSVDDIARSSTFIHGKVNVPGYSMAVFVAPQMLPNI